MKTANKSIMGLLTFVFALLLASCSTESIENPSLVTSKEPLTTTNGQTPLERFYESLDSLNANYSSGSLLSRAPILDNNNNLDKVEPNNRMSTKTADYIGKIAGGYGGKWIGRMGGAATGIPGMSFVGGFAGRYIGGIVGSTLFSYLAGKCGNIVSVDDSKMEVTGVLIPSDINPISGDSIGILHNYLMSQLNANKDKYNQPNGGINYGLIYADCVELLKDEGIYNDTIANDVEYRNNIINMAKEISAIANSCYGGQISINTMIDKSATLLKSDFNVDDEDIAELKSMTEEILPTCSGMETEEVISYAKDISTLIQKSDMTPSEKQEISSSASLIISSSLYWDHISE